MTKLKYFLRNLIVPVLVHLSIVGFYSSVDPCNGNPGCMGMTPTFLFLIVGSLPTLFVLFLVAIAQATVRKPDYSKYFKINLVIAILPYVVLGVAYVVVKLFS